VLHTAAWDDNHHLAGDRVAVIGTGATAVQLIPEVARVAGELTVYQRTPIYVVPKHDYPIPPAVRQLFARWPITQRIGRAISTSLLEGLMVTGVLHFRQTKLLNRMARRSAIKHLHRQVADPELRAKLTPDYDFGCKRPTFSNSYFRAFTKPHVHLETTAIERFEPDGIVTTDGRKTAIDTLVLATGYNIWDVNFPAFEIVGRDDRNLGKWWRDGRFQAFEGVAVPGFPNLLVLNGPYSYSGLSYFTTIESQMRHIARLFGELRRRDAETFEVTQQANDEFLNRVTRKLRSSVFYVGQCDTARSYYFNQHGEAAMLRPTSTINAFREAESFPVDAYTYSAA
jgi:cation diffusion facilitator CzcD-associated flavoprotein CzcO